MKKAIVLLSGGLDSSTALYLAKSQGFDEIYAITFEYGQKHDKELKSAIAIAKAAGVKEHKIVNLLLNQWSGCALTDPDMEVEDGHIERQDIPSTYVPARNMVFLSVAASWADALDITDIFIGVSEVDYSGYVDCREEFIKAMENAINLYTGSRTLLFPVERERICCFCRFGPASTDCRISFAYLLMCYAQICPERLNCKWGFSLGGK